MNELFKCFTEISPTAFCHRGESSNAIYAYEKSIRSPLWGHLCVPPTGVGWWAPLLIVWAWAKPSLWPKPSVLWALLKHSGARKVSEGQTPKINWLPLWELAARGMQCLFKCDKSIKMLLLQCRKLCPCPLHKWHHCNRQRQRTLQPKLRPRLSQLVSDNFFVLIAEAVPEVNQGTEQQCLLAWGLIYMESLLWRSLENHQAPGSSKPCLVIALSQIYVWGIYVPLEGREPCPHWSSI